MSTMQFHSRLPKEDGTLDTYKEHIFETRSWHVQFWQESSMSWQTILDDQMSLFVSPSSTKSPKTSYVDGVSEFE